MSNYRVTAINAGIENSNVQVIKKPLNLLALSAEPKFYDGYVKGYRQLVGLLTIKVANVNTDRIKKLAQALNQYFPSYDLVLIETASPEGLVFCFGQLLVSIQKKSEQPIFETIQVKAIAADEFHLWVPMLNGQCLQQAVSFLLYFMNWHANVTHQTLIQQRDSLLHFLRACAPSGSNCYRFLKAAHDANIPWNFIGVNSFQFGYGVASRWLDSSITDLTSQIGSKLTRDKYHLARLLEQAGFPTPKKYFISSEEEAIRLANTIGYPVVIKPTNEDGGDGVTANIFSAEILRKAFQNARKYSEHILLEKHFVGRDYRLVVLNGILIWAIERIPAGVFGDGIHTIEALIYLENQKPARTRELFPVKKLELTSEALEYLAENKWQRTSVPEEGVFVALCRIANISMGGTAVSVFDKVHPDNKRLAETVTKLCRLDLAGVDLILPDITKSYLETGGTIIEINAQPQLGASTAPHIYQQILSTLLPQKGRIPITVIFGKEQDELLNTILEKYFAQYQHVGIAKHKKAFINNKLINETPSLLQAGKALLLLSEVEALIYCIEEIEELDNGLPFDRYDLLYCVEKVEEETLLKACTDQVCMYKEAVNCK